MLVALGFQVDGDGDVAHADGAAHPGVVQARDVGVVLGDDAGNRGQRARTVVQHHPHGHVPAGGGESALDDLEHQHGVDVAAREDHRNGSGVFDLAFHERRDADGPGRFDHHLGALQQEDQRPGQGVFADGDDVVDELADDAERQLARPAHGDAVGHGGDLLERDEGVGGERGWVGGGVFSLDADDADLAAEFFGARLHRDGNAREESAAADTHQDGVDVGDLFEDLQPDRPLAGDDVDVIEGVDKDGAAFIGVALGFRQRLVHVVAMQHHLGAVAAGGGELGQCNAERHVDPGLDAQALGCDSHALGVVSGRGRHDAALLFGVGELGHPHVGTADLEGAGALQVFALEEDLAADRAAEGPR
ncbi:hypothetical protein SRABI128_04428 [Microbacterium sp. Bi128]|nr:hypothetical protein SRABI128_04428 [Microbacterium sp. Bi128]